MTAADYAAIAVAPLLIFVMISSLANFLILVLYQGGFPVRVSWIILMFTMGSVAVARIAIEQDRAYSIGYAVALGLSALVVISQYLSNILFAALILGLIGYLADRIVHDCTLIDDSLDASGQGLVDVGHEFVQQQMEAGEVAKSDAETEPAKKRKRKPHQPGRTVMYLALAALPLFGFGQFLMRGDPQTWGMAQKFLALYLFSSLSLLVTTSFLGLRRYLRQRDVDMPADVSVAWLAGGLLIIAAILGIAYLAPLPGQALASIELPDFLSAKNDQTASKYGWGNEAAKKTSSGAATTEKDRNQEGKEVESIRPQEGAPPGDSGDGKRKDGPAGKQKGGQKSDGDQSGGDQQSKSKSQQSKSAEQKSQEQKSQQQKSQQQDSQQQKSQQQDSQQQKSQQQDSQQQKSQQQDSQQQKSQQQDSQQQKSQQQDSQQQKSQQQDSQQQKSQQQDSQQQKSQQQDSQQQKSQQQDSQQQKSQQQDSQQQKSDQSESQQQKSEQQKSEQQKSEQQKSEQQKSEQQKSEQQKSEQQKSEQQKSGQQDSQQQDSEQSKAEQKEPEQQKSQQQTEQQKSEKQADQEKAEQQQEEASQSEDTDSGSSSSSITNSISQALSTIGGALKYVVMLALLIVVVAFVWMHRQALVDWWRRLFERDQYFEPDPALGVTEQSDPEAPPRPFASFRNPIGNEKDPRRVIVITFQAFEAWTREQGWKRRKDETPSEFMRRVAGSVPQAAAAATEIVEAYNRIVYGRGKATGRDINAAKQVWQAMS